MPAAKKHPTARARRNTAPTAANLPSESTRSGAAPSLPERADGDWHPFVLAWWRDLWRAGMSDEYHESDHHQLFVLAELYQAFWVTPAVKVRDRILLGSEIRLQRTAFGMTPYDRRRLEWTVEAAEGAKDRGVNRRAAKQPPAQPPKPADDPRQALRVV